MYNNTCLLRSETRMARLLYKSNFKLECPFSYIDSFIVSKPRSAGYINPLYYQNLHDQNTAYQKNNWLIPEIDNILTLLGGAECAKQLSLSEIGCGNGAFTIAASSVFKRVFAFDWARAPSLEFLPENITFNQGDIRAAFLDNCDIACSADVLEHFSFEDLPGIVSKICASARHQYHVIACYDDDHSHLTIMPPGAWLALFWRFCPNAYLKNITARGSGDRLVCTIASFPAVNSKSS